LQPSRYSLGELSAANSFNSNAFLFLYYRCCACGMQEPLFAKNILLPV
jgi:hypothetical protein